MIIIVMRKYSVPTVFIESVNTLPFRRFKLAIPVEGDMTLDNSQARWVWGKTKRLSGDIADWYEQLASRFSVRVEHEQVIKWKAYCLPYQRQLPLF